MFSLGWVINNLKSLAPQIPEFVVLLVGVVVSFANRSKFPRPALLSIIGFGILLGRGITAGPLFNAWVMPMILGGQQTQIFVNVFEVIHSLLAAIAYGLLICAIYASRKPRPPMRPSDESIPRDSRIDLTRPGVDAAGE